MRIPKIHAASLALAGALALGGTAAANAQVGYYYAPGYAVSPGLTYHPGFTANAYVYAPGGVAFAASPLPMTTTLCPPPSIYGKSAHAACFDPENGSDPDPRIGGSVKMNSSGND